MSQSHTQGLCLAIRKTALSLSPCTDRLPRMIKAVTGFIHHSIGYGEEMMDADSVCLFCLQGSRSGSDQYRRGWQGPLVYPILKAGQAGFQVHSPVCLSCVTHERGALKKKKRPWICSAFSAFFVGVIERMLDLEFIFC